jgi:hypothetical protein
MKRSTTPAIKDKPLILKSTAHLKITPQLKIVTKDSKKNLYSKIITTQPNTAL